MTRASFIETDRLVVPATADAASKDRARRPTFNPFRLERSPHPDPRVRLALAREYVRRELPMTYSGQSGNVLTALIGVSAHLWWIVAIGAGSFVLNGISRTLMRRFARALDDGVVALDGMIRRRLVFYVLIGASWGMVGWPAFAGDAPRADVIILPAIAVVALVVLATSSCFVPPFFTAASIGFEVVLLPFAVIAGGVSTVVLIVGLPVLQYLAWDLGRSTNRQLADMLTMQYERDAAIADQAQIIDQLDASRTHANLLASTDGVTQLPNRQAFMEHLGRRIYASGDAMTLVLLDLDYFKNINDTMGHHVGDAVLVAIATALRRSEDAAEPDRVDTFIARLGGDELALLIPGALDAASAQRRFDTWLAHFAELDVPEVGSLSLSATGGSAAYPRDGATHERLLNAADMALRTAKATCRGTHQAFQPAMEQTFNRDTTVASVLSWSIDHDEFAVFVQPQVHMADGRVVGAEILTRFTHPGLAGVAVQTIFDVAEERGLGHRLSDALLTRAGRTILELRRGLPTPIPLSVNLSPSTLKTPESLRAQLRSWLGLGIPPDGVRLEITEDAITGRGLDHVEDTLHAIAAMGFSLSLDDFGSGHSSMSHLRRLPITEIKIAKEFVEDVDGDRRDQAIVRAALTLCTHLDIDSVVEGIETPAQRDALLGMGADTGQGYLWARPVPRDEFVALMNESGLRLETPGAVAEDVTREPRAAFTGAPVIPPPPAP